jgi:hypothetical protein
MKYRNLPHPLLAGLFGAVLSSPTMPAQETPVPETPAQEQSEPLEFSGAVAVGAEHNDNLSIVELESASGSSDTAATLEANADLTWQAGERTSIASGYSYSGSRYQDLDAYDLDLHLLYADLSHDFALLTLGTNYYFADAQLGGDAFLELNQYSLYAGKLFGEAWYLRGALNFIDKEFDVFDARDADNEGFGVDIYRFFNTGRSNVTLGYGYEEEDAQGPPFDYSADTLRLRLNHRFTLAAHESRLQLGYRWQDRAYDNITPAINVPRDDSQRVAEARLEVDVVEGIAVVGSWEHADYESRLPTADFTNNRVSLAIEASFQAAR